MNQSIRNFTRVSVFILSLFAATSAIAQPLSGTYSIDGSGSGDYTSFTAAINALNSLGVSGATTFEVVDGTYNEQIDIGYITGSSSTNTITFRSQSGNAAGVIVEYSATSSANNYVVRFTSAKYITFQNLTLKALNWAYGKVITNNNTSGNRFINVDGCNLEGVLTTNSWSTEMYVLHFTGGDNDNVVVSNSTILNGNYGVYWYGNTSLYDSNNVFANNEFVNQYIRGALIYSQANFSFNHNHIVSNSTNLSAYAVYLGEIKEGEISGNYIEGSATWPRYGLYFSQVEGDLNSFLQVYNNRIFLPAVTGSTGLNVSQGLFLELFNNSIYMGSTSASSKALYMFNGAYSRVKNNIIFHDGLGYGIYVIGSPVYQMDYNNISVTNGTTGYKLVSYSTLADWQAGTSFDSNSYDVSSVFTDVSRLKVCADSLYGKGDSLLNVSVDFEGDLRHDPPCIGADEFELFSDFGFDNQFLCLGDTIVLNQDYYDTVVWNMTDTSKINYVSSLGTQTIEVFGSCGTGVDTFNVVPSVVPNLNDVYLCEGTSVVLGTGVSNATYLWSNGSTDSSIIVNSAQTVTVTVTDTAGCTVSDTSVITQAMNVDLPDSSFYCLNDSVLLSANIPGTYQWSTGQTGQSIYVSTSGMYSVVVNDQNCISSDSVGVGEQLMPIANFTDSVNLLTVVFTNSSQYADSFYWDFGDGSFDTVQHPTHIYPWTSDPVICYDVSMVAYNSCGVDTMEKHVCIGTIGVGEELENEWSIQAFPNPNNGAFNVKLEFAAPSTYSIYLYNSIGKSVYTKFTKSTKKSVTETMDVQNLAKGVYLMQVVFNGQAVIKKIIVE